MVGGSNRESHLLWDWSLPEFLHAWNGQRKLQMVLTPSILSEKLELAQAMGEPRDVTCLTVTNTLDELTRKHINHPCQASPRETQTGFMF